MNTYKLVALSGSLRKDSFNSSLIRAFKELAPDGVTVEMLDFSGFPIYDQDLEANFPKVVTDIKEKIQAADGVLISTPEYNRSIPGPLKNAFDWISRPYGHSAWAKKPVFVMSASSGNISGALAQYALRQALSFNNAYVPGQPEFALAAAQQKFDAEGNLTDEDTKTHIINAHTAFMAYIDTFR